MATMSYLGYIHSQSDHLLCYMGIVYNTYDSHYNVVYLGECVDRVTITYESGKVITLCGSQDEIYEFNNKVDRISPYPLIFKFQSSQCCHNCGFHIWLSCVPDPILGRHDTSFPYGYKVEQYKVSDNVFIKDVNIMSFKCMSI